MGQGPRDGLTGKEQRMIIDVHTHLFEDMAYNHAFVEECRKAGIDKICAFLTGMASGKAEEDPNRVVFELRKDHPDVVIALGRADHSEGQKALDYLERAVEEHDVRGLKQSYTIRASDPTLYPLIEKTIELKIPVLFHTFMGKPARPERAGSYPGETDVLELVDLARRYPEAMFIMAHYNLGDWEYGIKAVKSVPNIYPCTCGSGVDTDSTEFGVREVGAERIIFGTDNCIYASLGKIHGADLSDRERQLVLGENLLELLTRRGPLS